MSDPFLSDGLRLIFFMTIVPIFKKDIGGYLIKSFTIYRAAKKRLDISDAVCIDLSCGLQLP